MCGSAVAGDIIAYRLAIGGKSNAVSTRRVSNSRAIHTAADHDFGAFNLVD
jgi:hypothetical protein